MRTMPSGAYALIDREGCHYTYYNLHQLMKSFDDNKVDQPLLSVKLANIVAQLPAEDAAGIDKILGINITPDGHIVAASIGAVIVTNRELEVVDYQLLPGEHVENSVAVDEDGDLLLGGFFAIKRYDTGGLR